MQLAIEVKSYESIHVTLDVDRSSVHSIFIYRLDPTRKIKVGSSDVFAKNASLIDQLIPISDEIIIAGVYNIR